MTRITTDAVNAMTDVIHAIHVTRALVKETIVTDALSQEDK